jgi:ribosome-associated translation inhibitor RaiA
MQVIVSGESSSVNAQGRAYAEYRVFSVLAREATVKSARVVLRRRDDDGSVTCIVTVTFEPSGSVRARASGPRAPVAVDRAVDNIIKLLRRRASPPLST